MNCKLFSTQTSDTKVSLFILALRILFGGLLMNHGIQKLMAFDQLSSVFPDPVGIGTNASLILAIFGELVCSIAFIAGFLYRFSMIPMIVTMIVAFFVIHANDPFAIKEPAFIYLIVFLCMWCLGAGKYSIDALIGQKCCMKK